MAGGASLVAAALMSRVVSPALAANHTPPNIIYIITDDQGWKDVGYRGSDIKTPNIDKLAMEGARLEQFYAQPMCTPTRAALMTGRYPMRYGLQVGVIPQGGTYGVALDEYLLPQMLKDAGYATAMSGKWHLGQAKLDYWPHKRGFDSFYGAILGEINHFTHKAENGTLDWFRNEKPIEEEGFDNILFGKEARRIITEHDGKKPLFLYLAFTAPHTPFQAPQEYIDRYSHIEDESRRLYAAMISVVDDEIGKLIATLEERGMRDNTLIVFQSDNGGVVNPMFAGESAVKGKLPADNGPYRDGKGTTYEGGTRVAAFANWPGKIKPSVVNDMVHVTDMYATLASVAGTTPAKSKPLDGLDMWPTITEGKPSPRTEMVYNIDPMVGTVRQGDWKLVWTAVLPPRIELFNLAQDPSEKTNLAEQNPEIVKKLQARTVELASQMSTPLFMVDAVRLTVHSDTVLPDTAQMFNAKD